jgi:DNA-binding PadR family transcriptional regulator
VDVDNVKKACTETLILRLLREGPRHGYDMAKEVERRSEGYFTFKHGTLYPILHRLEKQGLIAGEWTVPAEGQRPKKHYRLTRKGRRYQLQSTRAWQEFLGMLTALVPEVAPAEAAGGGE